MNLTVTAYIAFLLVCVFIPQALNVYLNAQHNAEPDGYDYH